MVDEGPEPRDLSDLARTAELDLSAPSIRCFWGWIRRAGRGCAVFWTCNMTPARARPNDAGEGAMLPGTGPIRRLQGRSTGACPPEGLGGPIARFFCRRRGLWWEPAARAAEAATAGGSGPIRGAGCGTGKGGWLARAQAAAEPAANRPCGNSAAATLWPGYAGGPEASMGTAASGLEGSNQNEQPPPRRAVQRCTRAHGWHQSARLPLQSIADRIPGDDQRISRILCWRTRLFPPRSWAPAAGSE